MDTIKAMIEEHKIIVICRGVYNDTLLKTMEALYKGGIRLAEVTFNQRSDDYTDTLDSIRMLNEHFCGRMAIGAGTVVNEQQVELAHQAQAAYIISPNVNEKVIRKTKELGMVSIPGALSPTEVLNAHDCGADYVKLFPAARMKAAYIKDLMGPMPHVKFIATAGIHEDNITEFADVGCTGYGISGRLMDKQVIAEGNFEELQHRAEVFLARLQKGRVE